MKEIKRILALILCLIIGLSLCACKDNKDKETGVDIEYYANLGQIPESEFMLGDTGDTIKDALEKKKAESEKNNEDYFFNVQEGENNVLITDGTYDYYYKKAAPEKGISYLVSYSDAYKFELGTIISEVKKELKKYDVTEEELTEENAFFYMGDFSKASLLRYKFEKSTVLFVFEENALCATAIYSNQNWS